MDELEQRFDVLEARIAFMMEAFVAIAGGLSARGAIGDESINGVYDALGRFGQTGEQGWAESRHLRALISSASG